MTTEFDAAVADHDARVAELGVAIWIGGEPTFSRRDSIDPCWTFAATGGDKEELARTLLLELAPRLASRCTVGRAPGRQYGAEPEPRFAYGMQWQRGDAGQGAAVEESRLKAALDPPQQNPETAWMTITPDPGVIEVNLAPSPTLEDYHRTLVATYAAADAVGLSPFRFLFNGRVVDSGGGGQLSLGGPTPDESPFFRVPWLLPGLVRMLNRHPSLSYLFAPECVGSASQGPRPDEGSRELFRELSVALEVLRGREESFSPAELQASLGLLLVDGSGNSHRAELNIEKLSNPDHPRGGELGVVELRALRMPRTPERATAIAALYRSIVARIAAHRYDEPLVDWGAELHDRFALPSVLLDDLAEVLRDLEAHGFGLPPPLAAPLLDAHGVLGEWSLGDHSLRVTRALEFWPLLGDVASQEGSTSRTVDASTEAVEVSASGGDVWVAGRALPLREAKGRRVGGARYRAYVPTRGLHPGLGATEPLVIDWRVGDSTLRVSLYAWVPGGGAYDGLPRDEAEAAGRRAARVVVEHGLPPPPGDGRNDGSWVTDLRLG